MGITVAPREIEGNAFEKKNWGEGVRGQVMSILGDVQMTKKIHTILANIVYGINMGCHINAFYMRIFPSSNSRRKYSPIVWDW